MAHDAFIEAGDCYVNPASINHMHFHPDGSVQVFYSSGGGETFTGEQADDFAKSVGRHSAKHKTAKEAKAADKAASEAEVEAVETGPTDASAPPVVEEPEPKPKKKGK